MNKTDKLESPSMGLLHLEKGNRQYQLLRVPPAEVLNPFVKHYWMVSWDLAGSDPYPQHVVPNPCVNLVVERNKTFFFGPSDQKFTYAIHGKGCVFGVKFKPGGFYPFLQAPVSTLYGKPLEVSGLLGIRDGALEDILLGEGAMEEKARYMDQMLSARLPAKDIDASLTCAIVQHIEQDRDMLRVDQLSSHWNLHTRKLQRLFNQYVGISPKTVIQLYRLQNAAECIERGLACDLGKLSQDLGYHDQSHFIKDFKSIIGSTPEEYMLLSASVP
ncbi:helix-turn-helix transcriptional regulator [Paenibacillus cucumis (ex Kampfer et al. 2016)]|uniref:Helix-turn-helix transcriptional regulator n=2 Tax=Paenibacillus TaxID=44249 RepID=A0ABS7KHK8_9BACL|nr:helix-turn-helix transcriptional regulator [Paenibacillus cucumis (ex Kampfer et al. 2016)]MBY0203610.1 helix-turn-helix transcriptional regulator [Paenibacillus cucumis (ex Kampfer et al. 2016)]